MPKIKYLKFFIPERNNALRHINGDTISRTKRKYFKELRSDCGNVLPKTLFNCFNRMVVSNSEIGMNNFDSTSN